MSNLFEKQESLNTPLESFIFDAAKEDFPVKPHWHHFAEFIFMPEGSAEVTVDGRPYDLKTGEMILIHPSAVHSIVAGGALPVYVVLKIDLLKYPGNTIYSPSTSDIFKFAKTSEMPILFDSRISEEIGARGIFDTCMKETENYDYGFDVMLKAEVYKLIFGIVRLWIKEGLNMSECPTRPHDSYGIENIPEYIDQHLHENIKVKDIAEVCHISYSGFAAKFREQYGMSCKDYIERMRLIKADEYLRFTDMDINTISRRTGFTDSSHFIRSFKSFKGITPKQYRMLKTKI